MIRPVTFTTEKGNRYLYSPGRKQILLTHPLTDFFFTSEQNGTDLKDLLSEVHKHSRFTLEGVGDFSQEEFQQALNKYLFLKGKGFFKPKRRINLNGTLSSKDIKDNISRIRQLIFEVTEDCNLACTYCAYSKYYINKARAAREPDLPEIRKTINWFLSKRRNLSSTLTISFYGGEPLKNMKLIREVVSMLETLPGNKVPFRFTMTSNGVYLKKYIDYLVEHHFEVGISLDGDRESNAFRLQKNGKPSYSTVVRNLEYVMENHPDYFSRNISFMAVLHNRNNFGMLEHFFREKFGKVPVMSDISTVGISEQYKDEFIRTFIADKKEDKDAHEPMERLMIRHPRVKEISDIADKYSGIVFKNPFHVISPAKNPPPKKKFIPTATCTPFSLRTFITTEGKILPCEHISREFELGYVTGTKVHADIGEVASLFNTSYRKIQSFCNKCYLIDNCKECVFNTGIETDHPSCEFFMGQKKFSEYLARHLSIIESDYPFFLTIADHAFRTKGS